MKMKQIVAGAALVAATVVSAPALAGATGNVGAFSEYMFRGVPQTGGAAVQGGLDYAASSGVYAGIWGSNTNVPFSGGTEVDLYGGYATKFGDVGFDIGAIYYYYGESEEVAGKLDLDTLEFYIGTSYGPFAAKYFYSDDTKFFGTQPVGKDAGDGSYLTGSVTLPIKDTVNFVANVGYYSGDAVKVYLASLNSSNPRYNEDSYFDYGVGITKTLEGGFTASFSYIGTNIEFGPEDDSGKYVIGLKKTFDL